MMFLDQDKTTEIGDEIYIYQLSKIYDYRKHMTARYIYIYIYMISFVQLSTVDP